MRNVSTGAGLCVLSGTIAVCFAVSNLQNDGPAFAQSVATETASACTAPNETWFSTTPKIIQRCDGQLVSPGVQSTSAADVNGDGVTEYFSTSGAQFEVTWQGIASNRPNNPDVVRSIFNGVEGREVKNGVFCVSSAFGNQLMSLLPDIETYSTYMSIRGWRDMDGDGDLDLVCRLQYGYAGTRQNEIWLENVGFQRPPALNHYDLDQDGHVNIADVSLLLMEFTD